MDKIYNKMITHNLQKIQCNGFNYDPLLICEKDNRYCQAIFSIPTQNNTYFTNDFYLLQNALSLESNGITYHIDNTNLNNAGTFHFTFIQQLSFNHYYDMYPNMIEKCYSSLQKILQNILPFKIHYNRLIAVTNGLVLCGNASIDINYIRDEYRNECEINNIPLIEPYYLNIIHSTLFRFTNHQNYEEILNKYDHYLNNEIDYGYIVIDHFNFGKATWKVNCNEIEIDFKLC